VTQYFVTYSPALAAQDSGAELVQTYAPAVDATLLDDRFAAKFWRYIEPSVQTIQAAFGRLADNELARFSDCANIEMRTDLSPAGRADATHKRNAQALQQVDAIYQACKDAAEKIDAAIAQTIERTLPQLSDVAANTRELQVQAKWRAADRVLRACSGLSETTSAVDQLAKAAAAARDDLMMDALDRELPLFCRYKQISTYDANKMVENVERIRAATWDDAPARAARQAQRVISDGWGRLEHAVKRCREQASLDSGGTDHRILGLPGYAPDDTLMLNYPTR
jgi:hypothetical protein